MAAALLGSSEPVSPRRLEERKKELEADLQRDLHRLAEERKEGLHRIDWQLAEAVEALHNETVQRANDRIRHHKEVVAELERRWLGVQDAAHRDCSPTSSRGAGHAGTLFEAGSASSGGGSEEDEQPGMWHRVVNFLQRSNRRGGGGGGGHTMGSRASFPSTGPDHGGGRQSGRGGSPGLAASWPQVHGGSIHLDSRSQPQPLRTAPPPREQGGPAQRLSPPQLPLGVGQHDVSLSPLPRTNSHDQCGYARKAAAQRPAPGLSRPEARVPPPRSIEPVARGVASVSPVGRAPPSPLVGGAPTTPTRSSPTRGAPTTPSKAKPPPPPPAPHPFPQDQLSGSQRSTSPPDWLSSSQRGEVRWH